MKNMNPQGSDHEMIDSLQRDTFQFFVDEINETTGLIADKTEPNSPCSIAALGLALSTYTVAVERLWISRAEALRRTQKVLNFLKQSPQGPEKNATGYKGFYYHFLEMETGERAWECELSTIDTALLMAGILNVQTYFCKEDPAEKEVRELSRFLYERVDWQWALNGGNTFSHGWKPESGFLPYRWDCGYSEATILYILGLGSPTHPVPARGYEEWISTFELKNIYNLDYLYAGPLFIHQLSQVWLDFRDIEDSLNRKIGMTYFENSRRATYAQREYAIENPNNFEHYGENGWGFTASDGPGPRTLEIEGRQIRFFGYKARGAPFGPDDGTISPWAVVTSLPFAPEIVMGTIRHAIERLDLKSHKYHGFDASFNPSYPEKNKNRNGWVSPWRFGLNEGPAVLMIENQRSELIWKVMKNCPAIQAGLAKAGFRKKTNPTSAQ